MPNQKSPTKPQLLRFFGRMGEKMAPMIDEGTEMRVAERASAHLVAEEMRSEHVDGSTVEGLLREALRIADVGLGDDVGGISLSPALLNAFVATTEAEGYCPPELLFEKLVKVATGYRMILFPNESKHQGRPHLTVLIGDKKINVSIAASPEVLAGDDKIPGVSAVLKAVKKHRKALRKEWDDSRPDDQKLENSKRRKAARVKAI